MKLSPEDRTGSPAGPAPSPGGLTAEDVLKLVQGTRTRKRALTGRKWVPRVALWVGAVLAVVLALALAGSAVAAFIGTGGHLLGMLALALAGVVLVLVVSLYGLDQWMQAREVNRAVDRVEALHEEDPDREYTLAEAVIMGAGAVQTLGFWIMLGLVVLAVLLHASDMLTLAEVKPAVVR